ncbi:MAG: acyltransferase family protein, partial [Clostridia bacterium]|nr:acyltransferase family protein [Clostridia bacterium]
MRKITLHRFAGYGILKSQNNRLEYVDLMYLFGILMVVWGHSHPLDGSWWGTWYEHINVFIYSFHMPLYFFLGGYLMVHSSSIDRTGYKNWAISKLLKFLIPYIVLTAIAYL